MPRKGQFQGGESGNPNGRPKGTVNKRSITAAAIAKYNEMHQGSDAIAEIMSKMIEMAKDGDIQAAKLVIDRVEPGYKPISPPVDLGQLPKDLYAKGEKIILMATRAEIPVETAKELLASITKLMSIKERTVLEERVLALESIAA